MPLHPTDGNIKVNIIELFQQHLYLFQVCWIKQNESELANFDFKKEQIIVFNFL